MGGYPALAIRPPESPLQQLGQAEQVVGAKQEEQLRNLQIVAATRAQNDLDATTRAFSQLKPDASGKVDYDSLPNLVMKAGGSFNAVAGVTGQVFNWKEKASQIAKDDAATALSQVDAKQKENDQYRGRLLNIVGIQDPAAKQAAWAQEFAKEKAAGAEIPPGITEQYPGDDKVTAAANNYALGSTLVKEANERQTLAQNAWKQAGGALVNTVTGERIGGLQDVNVLNQGLETRWQVLHRGESLPAQFKLPANATPADFERIDKLLEATEKGQATKAQQDTVNAIRQQTYQLSVEKEGFNWVTGTATQGPAVGKVVAVPVSDIQRYGIQDAGKMEGVDITKTQSGRQWLTLANKQAPVNAPPDEKGIGQLIDELDKDGKLGPLAGRWNEFLAGKFGAGDPEYTALRTKLDLSNTLLATVHSGRLGPFLMENMKELAAAGKMDGDTLKAAFNSEKNYVGDRAMDPNPPKYGPPAGQQAAPAHRPGGKATGLKEGQTGTGDDGKKYVVKGGVWVAQ